jgi:hypothetical protein
MSRTKSFSSTLTKICELATQITILLNGAQDEFDKLAADSARLKEIEPALNRLQSALKPAIPNQPPIEPPATIPGEQPAEPPIESTQEPVKQHRSKKVTPADDTSTEGI